MAGPNFSVSPLPKDGDSKRAEPRSSPGLARPSRPGSARLEGPWTRSTSASAASKSDGASDKNNWDRDGQYDALGVGLGVDATVPAILATGSLFGKEAIAAQAEVADVAERKPTTKILTREWSFTRSLSQTMEMLESFAVPSQCGGCAHHNTKPSALPSPLSPTGSPTTHSLFSPATVTTSESKYAVSRYIAEYYCTITSPLFALPVLVYPLAWSQLESMGWMLHASILASILTAMASTVYHATLYRIWSMADVCMATVMLYIQTIYLMTLQPSTPIYLSHPATVILGSVIIALLFIMNQDSSAKVAIRLYSLILPFYAYANYAIGSIWPIFVGFIGVACFVGDRRKLGVLHPIWHLCGGLFLFGGLWDGLLYTQILAQTA